MPFTPFPTLSATAKLMMLFPEDTLTNPDALVRYDGGYMAVRELNHRPIWSNTVVLQVDAVDSVVVLDFIKNVAHMRVYPFQFTHPDSYIGTIVVRYMDNKLPRARKIQGLPIVSGTGDGSMYEIRLPLEEQYP